MGRTGFASAGVKVLNDQGARGHYAFSICTLMTRPEQYGDMLRSYRKAGFGDDCEYLCIDNSEGNALDAYEGCDAFLRDALGEHIILTHQDVELAFDDRAVLEQRLADLTALDHRWGACGNAGVGSVGELALRISDPHGENRKVGTLPARAFSLDENFIVVRRSANLSLSNDLSGYHLYGSDLCTLADIKGHSSYVIDFHLRHLSAGTLDADFDASVEAFKAKYSRAFRSRWLESTCTTVFLSSTRLLSSLMDSRVGRSLGKRWFSPAAFR